ncbi:MAG: elongation factor P hydroxylase [Pontibacterium sp.]
MSEANAEQLIKLFNTLFLESHNTMLVRGEDEPVYLPADDVSPHHRVIFAHGFFASALHEIAHWCVAGEARRQLEDFGYWYKPDGRTVQEQSLFEQVEVAPQALEWIMTQACGQKFNFSADNLSAGIGASPAFMAKVQARVLHYLEVGLPDRHKQLVESMLSLYEQPALHPDQFVLDGR